MAGVKPLLLRQSRPRGDAADETRIIQGNSAHLHQWLAKSAGFQTNPYRPCNIAPGRPFSQSVGAFQGRADMLSGSVLAQPERPRTPRANRRRNVKRRLAEVFFTNPGRREWPHRLR